MSDTKKQHSIFEKIPKSVRFKKTVLIAVIGVGVIVLFIMLSSFPKRENIPTEDSMENETENAHWLATNTSLSKPEMNKNSVQKENQQLTIAPSQEEQLTQALKELEQTKALINGKEQSTSQKEETAQAANDSSIKVSNSSDGGANKEVQTTEHKAEFEPSNSLSAGTMIPIMFMTEVNSELPGFVLAQVTRDVYNPNKKIVIPQASKILLQYEATNTDAQRLAYKGVSLVLPKGKTIALDNAPVMDIEGQMGLHDKSNHHYTRNFLAVAANFSAGQANQVIASELQNSTNNPNLNVMMPLSSSNVFSQKGTTFYVRAGYQCNLLLIRELVIPAY